MAEYFCRKCGQDQAAPNSPWGVGNIIHPTNPMLDLVGRCGDAHEWVPIPEKERA